MVCSSCGTKIRKDSMFCHKCGARVTADEGQVTAASEPVMPQEVPAQMTGNEQDAYSTAGAAPMAEERFDEYFRIDEEEPKKKKKGIIIGVIAAAAVVCLVCFICSNTFKRIFYKPADYYKYVERKNAKETISLATDWYDAGNLLIPGSGSVGYDDNLSLKMSEDILKDATEAMDVYGIADKDQDLSWLQDISISGKTTMYDELGSRNTAISIGDNTVLTLNTVADNSTDKVYLRIPELSDSYIGFEEEKIEELSAMLEEYSDSPVSVGGGLYEYLSMEKSLPETYKLTKIMTKYSDIFFDNMNSVEKSGKQKLEIGGVAQKCYCLTVDLDYKDMKNLGRQLREELIKDEDFREIYVSLIEAEGEDGEKGWDDFTDGLYVLEDTLGKAAGGSMKVYVDTCGHIIAREFAPADIDGTIRYGRTVNGRSFGAQFVVNIDGDDIVSLRGNGKKAGQNYAGDFKLVIYESDPIGITLDSFDYGAFKKQKADAQITVGIRDIAGALDMDDNGLDFLNDYKAVVSVVTPATGSYNTSLRLNDGVSDPVVIDYSYKKTGGSRITVPEDALMIEEFSDLKTYLKGADFSRVKDNLRSAGVPSGITGYIDYLEKAVDYLDYIDLFL